MNIIQLTPGSGDTFYCENCLRDAVMVRSWRKLGHDALVVPLYLPVQMDDVAKGKTSEIFMGGINVYLQQKSALFRKTPRWIDRWFDRPGLLRWLSRRAFSTSANDLAETTISMLEGQQGHQAKELERLVHWLSQQHRPDVVCLSNALLSGLAGHIRREVDVPIVCLLQDEHEFVDELPEPARTQVWDLLTKRAADIDMYVAVSHYYSQFMRTRLDLQADHIRVVPPGISPGEFEPAAQPPQPPTIGYLSRASRDKGLDILVEAFILLKRNGRLKKVRLRIAGGKTPENDPYLEEIHTRLREAGCLEDVEFLDYSYTQRYAFLRSLTVLTVPERTGPAYGLYALEALASGVAVVEPPVGVFSEMSDIFDEGLILLKENNPSCLAEALEPLLLEPDRAYRMGSTGRKQIKDAFDVDKNAEKMIAVFLEAQKRFENK